MTGVRANEGLALRWSDVDFDQKQIKVYHNLKLKSSIRNDYELSETLKTPKSKRTIDIDDTTICELKKWKAIQQNAFLLTVARCLLITLTVFWKKSATKQA